MTQQPYRIPPLQVDEIVTYRCKIGRYVVFEEGVYPLIYIFYRFGMFWDFAGTANAKGGVGNWDSER